MILKKDDIVKDSNGVEYIVKDIKEHQYRIVELNSGKIHSFPIEKDFMFFIVGTPVVLETWLFSSRDGFLVTEEASKEVLDKKYNSQLGCFVQKLSSRTIILK
jgi:hypothetical protein